MKITVFKYRVFRIVEGLWLANSLAAQPAAVPASRNFEFVENKGQWDNPSVFCVQLDQAQLFIEKNAVQYFFYDKKEVAALVKHPRPFKDDFKKYSVHGNALRIGFLNSDPNATSEGSNPFTPYYNFFLGSNRKYWQSHVRSFSEIQIRNLYPGIDLNYYTSKKNGSLKYDLVVHENTDPNVIRMKMEGADEIKLRSGALYIHTGVRDYIELKPYAYQLADGARKTVKCKFILDETVLGFKLGDYDPNIPLIIDPQVVFSTYSGSTADNFGHTATYDLDGNFYAAGIITGPYASFDPNGRYPATAGAFIKTYQNGRGQWPQYYFPCDISISKYNNDGTSLVYATYLGGSYNDYPHSLVVDKQNQLIVFGSTCSYDFPTTTGAYDTTFNSSFDESDIIVTKFTTDGTALVGSTYLGGSSWDGIMIADTLRVNYADEFRGEVQVNSNNEIVIASTSASTDFPTTPGVLQSGSKGQQEAVIFKLDSTLKKLIWSTYLGESNNDAAYSLDIDNSGNIYVAGGTQSRNFPVTTGVYRNLYAGGPVDGFIAEINAAGTSLLRSMFWGGKNYDQTYFIKLDSKGKVNVFGQSFDSMPVTANVVNYTRSSLYVSRFTATLDSLEYSMNIGNGLQNNALSPSAFIVDPCGNIYGSCWGGETNYYGNGILNFHYSYTTANMPLTANAMQSTTDNSDFYLFVLKKDAAGLYYGSYLGGNQSGDHVDGGTSRFDKRGIIY
ncbi:MAG: SBBP repeat-containing protein, partial [Bacteroidia bacterium]